MVFFYSNMMPADVVPPCCIPVEYESLTLLIAVDGMNEYRGPKLKSQIEDEKIDNVVLQTYENMSAKKCGCR